MRSAPVSKTKALLGKLVTMKATNEIIPFNNDEFGIVRTSGTPEKPEFCLIDVTKAIGYKDSNNAAKQHCRGVAIYHPIQDRLGRSQRARFITEGDLYRLLASSKLESAQRFESWVFDEVLPAIRKTGSYSVEQTREITSQVDRLAKLQEKQSEENLYLLNRLQVQQQEIERLQKQQKAALPAPRLGAAEGAMSTTQALRYLKYHYPHITRDWVFAKLRSSGCMCKNSCEPTVNGMRHGIVVPKIEMWVDYKGVKHVGRQYSHITSVGLDWLMNCARFEAMGAVM